MKPRFRTAERRGLKEPEEGGTFERGTGAGSGSLSPLDPSLRGDGGWEGRWRRDEEDEEVRAEGREGERGEDERGRRRRRKHEPKYIRAVEARTEGEENGVRKDEEARSLSNLDFKIRSKRPQDYSCGRRQMNERETLL